MLAACGSPLEDAIAQAEADGATPVRAEREIMIDALRTALADPDGGSLVVRAEARAWLGHLLVRHGRRDEARETLSNFEALADDLVVAEKAAAAVRGLTAYGTVLWLAGLDFEAPAPVDRAISIARDHLTDRDPLLVAALVLRARNYLTLSAYDDARTLLDDVATRLTHPERYPAFLVAEALMLHKPITDPRTEKGELDRLISIHIGLLDEARRLYAGDHPSRLLPITMLGEWWARSCALDAMHARYKEAVAFAEIVYGPRSNKVFDVVEEYGLALMGVGLETQGREMVLDARKWRYGAGAENLAEPTALLFEVPCVDPPQ
jgi:hypothetical protein